MYEAAHHSAPDAVPTQNFEDFEAVDRDVDVFGRPVPKKSEMMERPLVRTPIAAIGARRPEEA
jgi:hypothetical protein